MNKFVLVIRGPPASGKTTIVELLKKKIKKKLVFIDRDDIRHLVVDYSVKSKEEFNLANKNVCDLLNNFLKEDYFVIIIEVFNTLSHIEDIKKVAKNNNSKFLCVSLTAPLEVLKERQINRDQDIPFGLEGLVKVYEKYSTKNFPGLVIDATKEKDEIVKEILKNI